MIKTRKNKKANIPIIVLVLGVLVICATAVISFLLNKSLVGGKQTDSLDTSAVENAQATLEKFYFWENYGLSEDDAAAKVGATINGNLLTIKTTSAKDKNGFYKVDVTYEIPLG